MGPLDGASPWASLFTRHTTSHSSHSHAGRSPRPQPTANLASYDCPLVRGLNHSQIAHRCLRDPTAHRCPRVPIATCLRRHHATRNCERPTSAPGPLTSVLRHRQTTSPHCCYLMLRPTLLRYLMLRPTWHRRNLPPRRRSCCCERSNGLVV